MNQNNKGIGENQKLPKTLEVACCLGKSCGSITVYLDGTLDDNELKYIYRRESNSDVYTNPMNINEALEWVKNPPINTTKQNNKGMGEL